MAPGGSRDRSSTSPGDDVIKSQLVSGVDGPRQSSSDVSGRVGDLQTETVHGLLPERECQFTDIVQRNDMPPLDDDSIWMWA